MKFVFCMHLLSSQVTPSGDMSTNLHKNSTVSIALFLSLRSSIADEFFNPFLCCVRLGPFCSMNTVDLYLSILLFCLFLLPSPVKSEKEPHPINDWRNCSNETNHSNSRIHLQPISIRTTLHPSHLRFKHLFRRQGCNIQSSNKQ